MKGKDKRSRRPVGSKVKMGRMQVRGCRVGRVQVEGTGCSRVGEGKGVQVEGPGGPKL